MQYFEEIEEGRTNHISKDFRTIGLTSCHLKIFEKLFDYSILLNLPPYSLSAKQHAYSKSKSVDTFLYYLVGGIRKGLT